MPRLKASIAERLDSHSRREGECLVWTFGRDRDGYGRVSIARKYKRVHRVSWEISNGPIPDGLDVLHHCDNPPCRKESHLFLGTQAENTADKVRKNRHSVGVKNGRAKLTNNDVREIRLQYARGGITQRELAIAFNLCRTSIFYILHSVNWRHLKTIEGEENDNQDHQG